MSRRELAALEKMGIKEGDIVRTAYRGGVREGPVKKITDEPKVVFTRKRPGQPDKEVKHNPSTLEKATGKPSVYEGGETEETKKAGSRGHGRRGTQGGTRSMGGKPAQTGAGNKGAGSRKTAARGVQKASSDKQPKSTSATRTRRNRRQANSKKQTGGTSGSTAAPASRTAKTRSSKPAPGNQTRGKKRRHPMKAES